MSDQAIKSPMCLKDSYQYESLLGEGAFGKTWLAEDLKNRRKVAIKEFKYSSAQGLKDIELFDREIAALKNLHVKGVPAFYDAIITDTEGYLVQEYIPHPSLQSVIDDESKLDEDMTLDIIHKIALILDQLHSQYSPPIIHRDIKPSNILCDMSKRADIDVFLIDFGSIAKPQSGTMSSTVAGTYGYMSPEQLLGTVSVMADYYGLGATALHALTGISPADMPSEGFQRDFSKAISETAPKTSPQMLGLLKHLLSQDMHQRPQSSGQLLKWIERVRDGKQIELSRNDELGAFKKFIYLVSGKYRVTEGVVWDFFFNAEFENTCQYTFEAGGKSWCGFDKGFSSLSRELLPYRCSVMYKVSDPHINFLCESPTESIKYLVC